MSFPLDDITLAMIESSMETKLVCEPGEEPHAEGDGFTLVHLLRFLSGESTSEEERSVTVLHESQYSEADLIRALLAEVRRLRALLVENGHSDAVP